MTIAPVDFPKTEGIAPTPRNASPVHPSRECSSPATSAQSALALSTIAWQVEWLHLAFAKIRYYLPIKIPPVRIFSVGIFAELD
ncbi:MAG TPA: hypothetical protein V6D30_04120 [Leptolyngbyaceae cyanobacterium]